MGSSCPLSASACATASWPCRRHIPRTAPGTPSPAPGAHKTHTWPWPLGRRGLLLLLWLCRRCRRRQRRRWLGYSWLGPGSAAAGGLQRPRRCRTEQAGGAGQALRPHRLRPHPRGQGMAPPYRTTPAWAGAGRGGAGAGKAGQGRRRADCAVEARGAAASPSQTNSRPAGPSQGRHDVPNFRFVRQRTQRIQGRAGPCAGSEGSCRSGVPTRGTGPGGVRKTKLAKECETERLRGRKAWVR